MNPIHPRRPTAPVQLGTGHLGSSSWRARMAAAAGGLAAALVVAACASFDAPDATFSPAPTLSANIATVAPTGPSGAGAEIAPDPNGSPSSPPPPGRPNDSPPGSGTTDPCAVPAMPVVAVCLDEPWGVAPLPDGTAALVGERVSGRVLSVTAGSAPVEVATIPDVDASRGGGLLGIALSPYFAEDQLIYLYVTTATDARILRMAVGQQPKAIVTGLPAGAEQPGGSIEFGGDGLLYVVTGDGPAATDPDAAGTAATSSSLADGPTPQSDEPAAPTTSGTAPQPSAPNSPPAPAAPEPAATAQSVLRFDTSGQPAGDTATDAAIFSTGLTRPTGLCLLPGLGMGVLDHRSEGDVVIALQGGRDYGSLRPGDTLWTYSAGGGGALDCAIAAGGLIATARTKPKAVQIDMRDAGGFTGAPADLFADEYGLLRTVTAGPGDMAWFVTSNLPATAEAPSADDRGTAKPKPDPSDDRLIVLPPDAGGGGGGLD